MIYYRKCHIMKLFIVSELFFQMENKAEKGGHNQTKVTRFLSVNICLCTGESCKSQDRYGLPLQLSFLYLYHSKRNFTFFFNSAGTLFYRQLSYSQKILASILKILFFILLLIIPLGAREWDATIRKVK